MEKRTLAALVLLILFGAVIRFWNIGFQIMNYDEEFTISFAGQVPSLYQLVLNSLTLDFTPPLYYIAANISMLALGATATAIRVPSAIFGILTIPVAFLIGKEYKDALMGLLCAAFITTLYTMVFYSDFGRAYSLALLLVAISVYFFIRLHHGNTKSSIPFGIAVLAAFWTHLYTFFALAPLAFYWYVRHGSGTRWFWWIITAGSLPLLIPVYHTATGRSVITNQFGASMTDLVWQIPFEIYGYAAVFIIPLILYGLWKRGDDRLIRIFEATAVITILSAFALSGITAIIPHYAIFIIMLLLIPAIAPFYDVLKGIDSKYWYPVAISALLITLLNLYQIWIFHTQQRWIP